jgi:hypothetical protein
LMKLHAVSAHAACSRTSWRPCCWCESTSRTRVLLRGAGQLEPRQCLPRARPRGQPAGEGRLAADSRVDRDLVCVVQWRNRVDQLALVALLLHRAWRVGDRRRRRGAVAPVCLPPS